MCDAVNIVAAPCIRTHQDAALALWQGRLIEHEPGDLHTQTNGRLELWIGKGQLLLEKGESTTMMHDEPHSPRNPGSVPTVVLWAVIAA